MAGRALENGGNIALQNLGQPERAADMYKRASELFMQNMTPDRAAEMLEKSAKYGVDAAIVCQKKGGRERIASNFNRLACLCLCVGRPSILGQWNLSRSSRRLIFTLEHAPFTKARTVQDTPRIHSRERFHCW